MSHQTSIVEVSNRPLPMSRSDGPLVELVAIQESFRRAQFRGSNVDWVTLVWMLTMHAGVIAAAFFVEWKSVVAAIGLHWLTCSVGVCLAYHRCLAHDSFRLAGPVRFFVTLSGVLSEQGSPLMWAATHRVHHSRSDRDGDPYSPREGFWWSHLLWLFVRRTSAERQQLYRVFAPDLVQDRMLPFFERTYSFWLVSFAAVLFALGGKGDFCSPVTK